MIDKLKSRYGDLYTNENVAISATHTHSGPAGYFQYFLYEVTSEGFVNDSLNVIVEGEMLIMKLCIFQMILFCA